MKQKRCSPRFSWTRQKMKYCQHHFVSHCIVQNHATPTVAKTVPIVADVKSLPAQSTTNAYKEVKIMIYAIDYYDGQNRRMVEFISARSYDSAKRKFMLHHLGEDVVVINSI